LSRRTTSAAPSRPPNFKIQEHFNDFTEAFVKEAAPGNPEIDDGFFPLPDGPGLGVTIDEDVIAEHPRSAVHFNLFQDDWQYRQALRVRQ
jgi:galactonate dehydratase